METTPTPHDDLLAWLDQVMTDVRATAAANKRSGKRGVGVARKNLRQSTTMLAERLSQVQEAKL